MRKKISLSVLFSVVAVVIVLLLFGLQRSPVNQLEFLVVSQLGSSDLLPGSEFQEWTSALGTPSTVPQRDSANTFFYWPEKGVAVFCHPLYLGQFKSRNRQNWTVTSILIPVRRIVRPSIPPVDSLQLIEFSHLILPTAITLEKGSGIMSSHIVLHSYRGELQVIEIRKRDSLFGDYD